MKVAGVTSSNVQIHVCLSFLVTILLLLWSALWAAALECHRSSFCGTATFEINWLVCKAFSLSKCCCFSRISPAIEFMSRCSVLPPTCYISSVLLISTNLFIEFHFVEFFRPHISLKIAGCTIFLFCVIETPPLSNGKFNTKIEIGRVYIFGS